MTAQTGQIPPLNGCGQSTSLGIQQLRDELIQQDHQGTQTGLIGWASPWADPQVAAAIREETRTTAEVEKIIAHCRSVGWHEGINLDERVALLQARAASSCRTGRGEEAA